MAVTDRLTTYVAGRWQGPQRRAAVTDPADAPVVGSIGYGGSREALVAVDAAAGAFGQWPDTTARYRADLLRAAAEPLTERTGTMAGFDATRHLALGGAA